MKKNYGKLFLGIVFIVLLAGSNRLGAQQRFDPSKMNYLFNPKQNSIIYRDTVYRGSKEFRELFYRTHDDLLISFYQKHQSNKIWGNAFVGAGTVLTAYGVITLASGNTPGTKTNHTGAWVATGSGLLCTIFGGYLMMEGQKNLLIADHIIDDFITPFHGKRTYIKVFTQCRHFPQRMLMFQGTHPVPGPATHIRP